MRTRAIRGGSAVVLAALVVVACGGVAPSATSLPPDPGDKTGGRSGPIMITVVDSQPQGKPSNLPLAAFARRVEKDSGGSMAVKVVTDKLGDKIFPPDADVIEGVRNGAFEMAVVPARAWSDAGVTTFRALQAPFLIESDEQAAAIATDPGISAELLGGLEGSGVTGLVLYPEGLRHLFGFGKPILTLADMAGRNIRMVRSGDTDAIIRALGGVPIEAEFDALENGIKDGTIRGAESSFALSVAFPELSIATGNVVPYAKLDSLVVNDGFWASLSDQQRAIVRDAADATREWAIRFQTSDAEAAAEYCATGGSVVLADQEAVDEFRAAGGDLVAELAKDPAIDALMTRIRGTGQGLSAAPVVACQAAIAATIEPEGGDLPDGIYRTEFSVEYLESWHEVYVNNNRGVWTFRLEDGHWTLDRRADNLTGTDHAEGIYQVKGDEVYWRWHDRGQPIDHLIWSVERNGDLTFTATPDGSMDWPFALGFERLGPLSD